jgi:hypothetical protein
MASEKLNKSGVNKFGSVISLYSNYGKVELGASVGGEIYKNVSGVRFAA